MADSFYALGMMHEIVTLYAFLVAAAIVGLIVLGQRCITTDLIVLRRTLTTYSKDAPRGSGYCEDHVEHNVLLKRWKFKDFVLHQREIDREEIPAHVWIAAAFQHDAGWQSKFHDHITAQKERQ